MVETIITIIALVLSVAASILVIRLLLNDKTFVFNCQHCGNPLPRFHKGYCSMRCMINDRSPAIPPPPVPSRCPKCRSNAYITVRNGSYHCLACNHNIKKAPGHEPETMAPEAVRLIHSLHVFDDPGPARIYPIRCRWKRYETVKFIAAHSPLQAYYRFFSRYPGLALVPEDPKPC